MSERRQNFQIIKEVSSEHLEKLILLNGFKLAEHNTDKIDEIAAPKGLSEEFGKYNIKNLNLHSDYRKYEGEMGVVRMSCPRYTTPIDIISYEEFKKFNTIGWGQKSISFKGTIQGEAKLASILSEFTKK